MQFSFVAQFLSFSCFSAFLYCPGCFPCHLSCACESSLNVLFLLARKDNVVTIMIPYVHHSFFYSPFNHGERARLFPPSPQAIYEMRSASCSLGVSGFSIHRRVHADDGSSKVVDGVSKPYNRFGKDSHHSSHH